jgi:hypothetical protein
MHAPPPSRAATGIAGHRRLRRVVQCLDVDEIAQKVAAGFPAVPAGRIARGDGPAGSWEDVVRRVAELIRQRMLTGDNPDEHLLPELYEAARAAAADGLAHEEGFRACCAAGRAVWAALLETVPAEDWSYLMPQSDVLWASVDEAVRTAGRAFDDQRELPSSRDNYRARTLFTRLCGPAPVTVEDQDRADRLGFPLKGPYSPFVARLAGGSAASHAYLAARLRGAGALAYSEGQRVCGLTTPGFDWRPLTADGTLILATQPSAGQASNGQAVLADAVNELHDLITLAETSGRRGWIHPEDFLAEILLANSPQLADRILRRVFGRLEDRDPAGMLTSTLTCLAASGFDRAAAASALQVHRNTLLYRMNRIEQLSGLDLDRHAHRELVRLATVWRGSTTPP